MFADASEVVTSIGNGSYPFVSTNAEDDGSIPSEAFVKTGK